MPYTSRNQLYALRYWGAVNGVQYRNVMVDSVSKDDTKRRKKPLDLQAATTSRYAYRQTRNPGTPFTYYHRLNRTYYEAFALDHHSISDFVLSNDPSIKTALENRVRSDVRGLSVNIANMLGEYRQTASLFGDLTKDLLHLTVAALKKEPRLLRPKQTWDRTVANRHLQYVYGVSPLVSDLDDSMKLLKQGVPMVDPVISDKVSRKVRKSRSLQRVSEVVGAYKLPVNVEESLVVKNICHYDVVLDRQILANTLGNYGLTNPLSLLWELTPYSFVVDWWLNVGELIASLDNPTYIKAIRVQHVAKTLQFLRISVNGESSTSSRRIYDRGTSTAISTVARPRWKLDPSTIHIVNGIALARGALSSFSR